MPRLLCFGDLHLGQGGQYGRHPGDRLHDQADVLGRIAGLTVEHSVDGVLFAGDAFEGPGIPPEQLAVFAGFVEACRTIGIPVLAIVGNGRHDAAVRDTNGMAIFRHVPGIEVASLPDVYRFAGCAVATLPWVHPGRLVARLGRDVPRDEINQTVAELLVDVAAGLREDCGRVAADAPAVLLAHWSITGTSLPAGLPVADLREPVIPLEPLEAVGFDHIVAGHIHNPQPVGSTGFYTGSPLPLNFGEEHVGHGVWVIDTDTRQREFVPIDSRAFITLDFDFARADAATMLDLFVPEIPEGAIVRARYRATSEQARSFDVGLLRAELAAAGAAMVKVEPTIVRDSRARAEGVDEQLDTLAALDLWLDATGYPGDRDLLRSRAALYLETDGARS